MPSNHLILCCHLLLLPSIFPRIRVFSNESVLHTGGQSIGASALAPVLPMIIQGWFPLGLTGLIPLQSKGLLGQVECLLQARLRQSLLRIEAGSHSFSGEKVTLWKCSLRAAFKKYHHLSEKLLTMFNFGAVALFCLSVLPVYLSVLPQAANSSTTKLCLFISPLLSTMPCV